MGKIKYDVSDVDTSQQQQDYEGEPPQPGLYNVTTKVVKYTRNKADTEDMLMIVMTVDDEPYVGAPLFGYITFAKNQDWKMREFMDAIGAKPKGALDVDDSTNRIAALEGKACKLRVKSGQYNGQYSPNIDRYLPVSPDGEDGSVTTDPDAGDDEPPF